jgi:hypothetical protein
MHKVQLLKLEQIISFLREIIVLNINGANLVQA